MKDSKEKSEYLYKMIRGGYHMKIAVTYENGVIFQHFGKCENFLMVEVEEQNIVGKTILNANGQGHGALAGLLREAHADVLICGGLGQGARDALQQAGIVVIGGAKGNAEAAVDAYLKQELHDDPQGVCNHHEGHHDCSDHEHCHN